MTKLLLVEDDPFLGDLVVSDLNDLYPHGELQLIGPATTYQEAISLIQSERPDIALLDINLGSKDDFSGIRIAEYLNRTHPIPIIFLSGLPRGFDQAKYTLPVAYLRKPYRKQDLADQLELLLVRKSMEHRVSSANGNPTTSKEKGIVFLTVNRGEMVPLHLDELLFLEADGKIIRAYTSRSEFPIVFTSSGLKNFFEEHLEAYGNEFYQLSRQHVIHLSRIHRIKDNHVFLQWTTASGKKSEFKIPIPANGDNKRMMMEILSGAKRQ